MQFVLCEFGNVVLCIFKFPINVGPVKQIDSIFNFSNSLILALIWQLVALGYPKIFEASYVFSFCNWLLVIIELLNI